MHILQKELEACLNPAKIVALFIAKRFRALKITLSQPQIDAIAARLIRQGPADQLLLDITEAQWKGAGFLSEAELEAAIKPVLEELPSDVEKFLAEPDGPFSGAFDETTDKLTKLIATALDRSRRSMLQEHCVCRLAFESRIHSVWGKALDALETHIVIAQEAGDDFNREFRRKAARDGNLVFDVLIRSHARACQIASEVLSLLRSGHADGAIARWRSLHEVSVVSSFISKQGHEVAERYLLHNDIESCKAAKQLQCYHGRIGQEPFDPDQIAMMEKTRDILIKRYGKNYDSEYGWASQALRPSNPHFRPNFSDIEMSVDLDHLRPYYKMASHKVHANPKGVLFNMGLLEGQTDMLLAGPSNVGLADPGDLTAISLTQVTSTLLLFHTNLDMLVISKILLRSNDDVGRKFLAADTKLRRAVRSRKFSRNRHSSRRSARDPTGRKRERRK